ncbi:response regulator [Marinicrinis lubricantis]
MRYRVLIVDDEYMIHLSLKKLIQDSALPFDVVAEAEDGSEALNAFEQHLPEIVITDIWMPEMDGLAFIESAKHLKPNTLFIILSGYNEFEYAQKAIRFGVSDFLLKPIVPEQLHHTLHAMYEKLVQSEQRFFEQSRWFIEMNELRDKLAEQLWTADEERAFQTINQMIALYRLHPSPELTMSQFASNVLHSAIRSLEMRDIVFSPAIQVMSRYDPCRTVEETMRGHTSEIVAELKNQRNLGSRLNILKAVQYMEEHFCSEQLTLQEVADSIGISAAYFSRSFRQEMNVSFIKYLIQLRLNKAQELLETTDDSTMDIAHQVGFSDYPHFSKSFKKAFGVTPSHYRKQLKLRRK